MKNLIKLLVILLIPALVVTSCKDDNNDPELSEFEALSTYLAQNNLDLTDVLDGWVKPASAIGVDENDYSVPDYFVMDIRSAADFEAGHIKDAVNVAVANVLEEAENAAGKPILVVCYTGQTAARVTGLLRLMDFNAFTLKWGMSGWNTDLAGKWQANAGDYASANWLLNGDPVPVKEFAEPVINTGETDGAAILRARVRTVLQNTSWGVKKDDVLANPENYFINNKWPLASFDEFGHISGAYRIDENLNLTGLKYLDPASTMVTYCYTGQTSSITNAWLEVLGYNGKSLLFGANGIVHSSLVNSDVDSAKKKSWGGDGSASQMRFGYYDSNGNYHGPN